VYQRHIDLRRTGRRLGKVTGTGMEIRAEVDSLAQVVDILEGEMRCGFVGVRLKGVGTYGATARVGNRDSRVLIL
jgi:hypothetical protein